MPTAPATSEDHLGEVGGNSADDRDRIHPAERLDRVRRQRRCKRQYQRDHAPGAGACGACLWRWRLYHGYSGRDRQKERYAAHPRPSLEYDRRDGRGR